MTSAATMKRERGVSTRMGNMTGGGGFGGGGIGGGAGMAGAGFGAVASGHGVRRWWQAPIEDTESEATLAFVVPREVPPRLLERATRRALRAASSAAPGRGKVRASGRVGPEGVTRLRVEVRLSVRGEGADKRWALLSEAAFADAFARTLTRKKFAVTRLDRPG